MVTVIRPKHFIIKRKRMTRTRFHETYGLYTWIVDVIDDGQVALHLIDGKVLIDTEDTIKAIWPHATYEIAYDEEKADLFD
jgi:hypothetical protein